MDRAVLRIRHRLCLFQKREEFSLKAKGFYIRVPISLRVVSSRAEVFCKKGILRNFAKFTGKHLCQSLFFNKVAGLRPATLSKNRLWHRYFTVNFVKFVRTAFLTEHLRWLLLSQSEVHSELSQTSWWRFCEKKLSTESKKPLLRTIRFWIFDFCNA